MDEDRHEEQADDSAFGFDGTWQEFAPIAFTNLLLTIVTLGIYRFWATARERRYLWSRSRFVDEPLEWSGTGMELFIGFLLVLLLLGVPFTVMQLIAQGLILRQEQALGGAIVLATLLLLFYLTGVARFRALRYRLSRTRWRGIRGGSDNQGWRYGLSYMIKSVIGWLPLGLLVPWSMTSLWNERVGQMSFGPNRFAADASPAPIFARFFLFYLIPFLAFLAALGFAAAGTVFAITLGDGGPAGIVISGVIVLFGLYLLIGLIAVAFYAGFYREVIGATRWGDVEFQFGASTRDWVKLLLGDVALVVVTLGIGVIFLGYRHWKFFMVHMDAQGEILLDQLTQSTTRTARHGEGLLDAFDIGAI